MHTVFPTGTTVYNPEKCFNGYTLYPSKTTGLGAVLLDMNRDVVRTRPNFKSIIIKLQPAGTNLPPPSPPFFCRWGLPGLLCKMGSAKKLTPPCPPCCCLWVPLGI